MAWQTLTNNHHQPQFHYKLLEEYKPTPEHKWNPELTSINKQVIQKTWHSTMIALSVNLPPFMETLPHVDDLGGLGAPRVPSITARGGGRQRAWTILKQ